MRELKEHIHARILSLKFDAHPAIVSDDYDAEIQLCAWASQFREAPGRFLP